MPFIVIDPVHLTPDTSEIFKIFLLFEIAQGKSSWTEGQIYSVIDVRAPFAPITIQLTLSILLRARKLMVSLDDPLESGRPKDGYRFEVYQNNGKKIGQGDQGKILGGLGTIVLDEKNIRFHRNKERAIKFFKSSTIAQREATISILVPHLHAKPVMRTTLDGSAMVMRKLPGQTLGSLLKTVELQMIERLSLSLEVLQAYQAQVADISLLHRDIKPSNIMVHMIDEQWHVNFIDYATACIIDDNFFKLISRFEGNDTAITLPPVMLMSPVSSQAASCSPICETVVSESPLPVDTGSPVRPNLTPSWDFMLPLGSSSSLVSLSAHTIGVVGTFGYIPPEGYEKSAVLTKSYDYFALGKVLADIWGVQVVHYKDRSAAVAQKDSAKECFLGRIPATMLEQAGDRAEIERFLTELCHADAERRPTLKSAISLFESILNYYQEDMQVGLESW